MTLQARERSALMQRLDELVASPSLAHLVDHYLERLETARATAERSNDML